MTVDRARDAQSSTLSVETTRPYTGASVDLEARSSTSYRISYFAERFVEGEVISLDDKASNDLVNIYFTKDAEFALYESKVDEYFASVPTLDYTTFGTWALGLGFRPNGFTAEDFGAYHTAVRTPSGGVPTVGGARYQGSAMAFERPAGAANGDNAINIMTGITTADADFANDMISVSIEMNSDATGRPAPWGTVQSGPMAINRGVHATFGTNNAVASTNDGSKLSGNLKGSFNGPGGREIGGTFDLEDGRDRQVIGSFGAASLTPRTPTSKP